jgi:hypothetical protein
MENNGKEYRQIRPAGPGNLDMLFTPSAFHSAFLQIQDKK